MRFQVPQFIEVEDKIFGQLTIKQFVYLAGGAGMSFILFRFFPLIISVPLIVVVVGFSLAMAFYQVNNKPLIFLIQNAIGYLVSSKLYLWKKSDKSPEKKIQEKQVLPDQTPLYIPKLSKSKLQDLTWSLDIKDIPSVKREASDTN